MGIIRGGDFNITVPIIAQDETHVGLAGTHPDFADEDILDFNRLRTIADGDALGLVAGGDGVEFDEPFALRVGLGGLGLAGEGHGDGGAGRVPTPQRIGLLLLKDHMVANDGGEFNFRVYGHAREGGGQGKE